MVIRVVLAAAALAVALPLAAHHSLSAKYYTGRIIMVDGTITKVDWSNPHARLYLDIKDPTGMIQMWDFEMASPNLLMINGWRIDSFRRGDHVLISAHPSRDGSHNAFATKVTLEGR